MSPEPTPPSEITAHSVPGVTEQEIDVLMSLCLPAWQEKYVASTPREIAADLGISESAVTRLLHHLYEVFEISEGAMRRNRLANEVITRGVIHLRGVSEPEDTSPQATAREARRMTLLLIDLATWLLPAVHRARFREEWASLLTELPTRRARARQVFSLLRGTPRQCWVLRRPLGGRRAA